ncbi:MAG: DUF4426 domain-containing protein [Pseudomonadota bacterium]
MLTDLTHRRSQWAVLGTLCLTLVGCGSDGPPANATIPQATPSADNQTVVGDHTIHINAVSTDAVPPSVAQSYGIVRSQNRALLNVAVIETDSGKRIETDVSARAVNLTGQLKNITLRKIEEPGEKADEPAVYYIGEVPVANRETLTFDVTVVLPDADEPVSMKFSRQFYSD